MTEVMGAQTSFALYNFEVTPIGGAEGRTEIPLLTLIGEGRQRIMKNNMGENLRSSSLRSTSLSGLLLLSCPFPDARVALFHWLAAAR
jgi:hypothetical protein